MIKNGFVSIHREITEHWIWDDPDKLRAWIDLILMMNFEDSKLMIHGKLQVVKRGQHFTSISKLATRWYWSREKVKRFLDTLQSDNMITYFPTPYGTFINVVNYSVYQNRNSSDLATHKTSNKSTNKTSNKSTHLAANKSQNNKENKENKENKLMCPDGQSSEGHNSEWFDSLVDESEGVNEDV